MKLPLTEVELADQTRKPTLPEGVTAGASVKICVPSPFTTLQVRAVKVQSEALPS